MPKKQSYERLRNVLRVTPEYQIRKLFEMMEITGLEKEIAIGFYVEHKSVQKICDEQHIGVRTFHNYKNLTLSKIMKSLKDVGDDILD